MHVNLETQYITQDKKRKDPIAVAYFSWKKKSAFKREKVKQTTSRKRKEREGQKQKESKVMLPYWN